MSARIGCRGLRHDLSCRALRHGKARLPPVKPAVAELQDAASLGRLERGDAQGRRPAGRRSTIPRRRRSGLRPPPGRAAPARRTRTTTERAWACLRTFRSACLSTDCTNGFERGRQVRHRSLDAKVEVMPLCAQPPELGASVVPVGLGIVP